MARRIATGIDIGTHHTKVVVVEELASQEGPVLRIIGTGIAETRGLRHGYVVDAEDAAESVRAARQQAEQTAQVPIKKGFLAIGGISLDEVRASGETVISRADQEITDLDIEKTREAAREAARPNFLNRTVLHEIPLEFRVDGTKSLGEPVGLKGTRLEADYLFITCLTQHAELLETATEAADIEVIDRMASPLAGSYVTLTKDQKMKGCVLANIGAETVSIVVYDEGLPVSVKVFPIGSTHITDDLALGFKVSLEDAERLKLGRLSGSMYPRRKVEEIVTARFRAMFELIDKHLKQLGRGRTLPAGIIISGGGAGQGSITDIAKGTLNLPSRIADMRISPEVKVRDATWAVAYGLALWGLTGDTETPKKRSAGDVAGAVQRFFKQFLP
ncbi:MAG TPA: cell division protein FtsA [Candidatus Paceibacterota bacterium]|nr:cell division protein FtsA [Candidatus Paceibacterota bacterium]